MLYDVFGLIDGVLEAGLLRLDFDADFDIVFRLLNFVLDIKDNSSAFFFRLLLDFRARGRDDCQ